jgi:hypothetical protein
VLAVLALAAFLVSWVPTSPRDHCASEPTTHHGGGHHGHNNTDGGSDCPHCPAAQCATATHCVGVIFATAETQPAGVEAPRLSLAGRVTPVAATAPTYLPPTPPPQLQA